MRAHEKGIRAAAVPGAALGRRRERRAHLHRRRHPAETSRGPARQAGRLPLRRTWLFVPGADPRAHAAAARSGADVIILDLEDFTPPALRAQARELSPAALDLWRT